MELTDNAGIEKCAFGLVMYSFISLFLTALLMSQPPDLRSQLIIIPLVLPCVLGGIAFLFLGTKFRSAIYLCVGASVLLPVAFLGPMQLQRTLPGLFLFVFLCILTIRCGITKEQKLHMEKGANYLATFTLLAPLFTYGLYLFARSAPVEASWRLFPSHQLMWLAALSAVGGIVYLFLGAKHRSFKYASMGLATAYIAFIHFAFTLGLAFSFMD